MIVLAALLLVQVSAEPPAAPPSQASSGTVPNVDPIGDWLVSESDLKPGTAAAARTAYAHYRAAGGTATLAEWRRALVRGTAVPFVGNGEAWTCLPAPTRSPPVANCVHVAHSR